MSVPNWSQVDVHVKNMKEVHEMARVKGFEKTVSNSPHEQFLENWCK